MSVSEDGEQLPLQELSPSRPRLHRGLHPAL